MNIEKIRKYCLALPHVTEDIKWGHDLCFCIAEKMFVVLGADSTPVSASFKTTEEEFYKLSTKKGFKPAPYVARYKWIYVEDIMFMSDKEWKQRIQTAYDIVKEKLPKKILNTLK